MLWETVLALRVQGFQDLVFGMPFMSARRNNVRVRACVCVFRFTAFRSLCRCVGVRIGRAVGRVGEGG